MARVGRSKNVLKAEEDPSAGRVTSRAGLAEIIKSTLQRNR